jgi:glycosyltransferase involved in cell wall biosynthesis
MALPVRIRGGVPLKLIEAMAAQRPVVTTSAMVAGLRLVNGRDLLVADSPSGFAHALHLLLSDEDFAVSVATAARRIFEEELSTEAVMDRIVSSSVLAVDRQRPQEA